MPENTQQSEDHLFNVLFLTLIMLLPLALLICSALLSLELNIDFLAAVLLIIVAISLLTFVAWWLSGKSWMIKLLNKWAGGEIFSVPTKEVKIKQERVRYLHEHGATYSLGLLRNNKKKTNR